MYLLEANLKFLGTIDWIFVILYLLVIAGVSVWSIRKSKETTSDYFLANRNLGWFVIGASIWPRMLGQNILLALPALRQNQELYWGIMNCIPTSY